MTANESKGEKDRCLAAGMGLFLGKPPLPEDLDRVLVRVFGQEMLNRMREEQEGNRDGMIYWNGLRKEKNEVK